MFDSRLVMAVVLAASGCAAPSPLPVPLPSDAPLTLAECGWPVETPLAFARWAELGQLGLRTTSVSDAERVFVAVTMTRVEQRPMIGPIRLARWSCVRQADGLLAVFAVPDDWQPPISRTPAP
jgi:hypothetical protein